jgi:DNA damage-binding protein 1
MELLTEFPVQGRIRSLAVIPGHQKDYIAVLTHQLSIVSFEDTMKNEYTITIQDIGARPSEIQWMGVGKSAILLYQTVGLLKIIPFKLSSGSITIDTPINTRLDRLDIFDLAVDDKLYVLHVNNQEKYLTTYKIHNHDLEVQSETKVDSESYKLLSTKTGMGVISTGSITIYGKNKLQLGWEPMIVSCVCSIDHQRYLLGSDLGLALLFDNGDGLSISFLSKNYRQITTVQYLFNGSAFCGSHFGDSVVLNLKSMAEIQRMESTSPITDFVILPTEEQTTIVTCSGYNESGGLKIVTNGVGIEPIFEFDTVATGVWTLNKAVVVSGIEESCKLENGKVVDQWEGTVIGAAVVDGYEIIVSPNRVFATRNGQTKEFTIQDAIGIVHSDMLDIVRAMGGEPEFGHVCFSDQHVALSIMDYIIVLKDLELHSAFGAKGEVSCLGFHKDLIVVGVWSMELLVYTMNGTETTSLAVYQVPRSISGLLVGFGDGTLISYAFDNQLKQIKSKKLGNQPLHLVGSLLKGNPITVVSGERVWIVDEMIKNVNVTGVHGRTCIFDETLVYVSDAVKFGKMEHTEKLHVKSIKMGETVRRVCKISNFLVCLCSKTEKVPIYSDAMPGLFSLMRWFWKESFGCRIQGERQH